MEIPFDKTNPYPLLPEFPSYREAQLHSREVDEWIGLHVDEHENIIARNSELSWEEHRERWSGLNPDALQTPYTECRAILNLLNVKPGQTVVDLGAGYGRMGFVMGVHYPESYFVGYEIAADRVNEAERGLAKFNFKNVKLICQDLARPDFVPVQAEYYFIYDFGSARSIHKTLLDLKILAREKPITVVGRGRGCRDQIERHEPWLSQMNPPNHQPHFSIYKSD